jgi:TDG/mug DNA glycosylase family protein
VKGPDRPTRAELAAAAGKTVRDVIGPGLTVLFCGINPGLYSAATGHHFARPGNRFWPALHAAGFTDHLVRPWEEQWLLQQGLGITNLVRRGTATAAELTPEEFRKGRSALERKIRRYRPGTVAILGIGAYRAAFQRPDARLGPQPDRLGGAVLWLLPNPSGLNAHHQLADLVRELEKLREFATRSHKALSLVTLGVGAQASPRYAPAGLLVEHAGVRVMIDGGPGAAPAGKLAAWLVTDMQSELIPRIRELAGAKGLEPYAGPFRAEGLVIECHPVIHTSHPAFGYLIRTAGNRVVWAPEFFQFPAWAGGATLMFAEAAGWNRPIRFRGGVGGHLDVLAVAKAARRRGVRRLVFAHIGRPTLRAIDQGKLPPFGEIGADGRRYVLTGTPRWAPFRPLAPATP